MQEPCKLLLPLCACVHVCVLVMCVHVCEHVCRTEGGRIPETEFTKDQSINNSGHEAPQK